MFLKHFDLAVNPFGMTAGLDFLFKSTPFEESMAHLVYGLQNNEAIVLISGPIGSGKTMALQSFLSQLGDNYLFGLVTNTQVTHIELLKLILDDLEVEFKPDWDKSDLLIAFKDYAVQARARGKKILVIIDEAQNLSSEVLEEVRLLTNMGQGAEQLIQLILVGQPELKEILNQPELAQLRQRIRVHYEVETLSYPEMVGYVQHRMKVAGCERNVFQEGALRRLFELSGGVPRLVNTHAGNALLSAFVARRNKVTAQDVEEGVEGDADFTPPPVPSSSTAKLAEPAPPRSRSDKAPPVKESSVAPPLAPEAPGESGEKAPHRSRKGGGIWLWILLLAVAGGTTWYFISPETFPWKPGNTKSSPASTPGSQTPPPAVATPEVITLDDGSITGDTGPQVVVSPIQETEALARESSEPEADLPNPAVDQATPPTETAPASTNEGIELATAPATVQEPAAAGPAMVPGFFIHVASFRTQERSEADREHFAALSLDGMTEMSTVGNEDWYRVFLGPYASHDEALEQAYDLLEDGTIGYYSIVERQVDASAEQNR